METKQISEKDVDYLSEQAIEERVDNFTKVNKFVKGCFDWSAKPHNENVIRLDMRF